MIKILAGPIEKILERQAKLKEARKTRAGWQKIVKIKAAKEKKVKTGPGRPRLSYKHRHPVTGKPIPATEWYQVRKALKRKARTIATGQDIRQQQMLARRGISPAEAQSIEMMRLRRIAEMQAQAALQPQQQIPIRRLPPVYRRLPTGQLVRIERAQQPEPAIRIERDLISGRPIIKRTVPRERWTL